MAANLVEKPPITDAQQLCRALAVPPRAGERTADGIDLGFVAENTQRQIRRRLPFFQTGLRPLRHLPGWILISVRSAFVLRFDFIHSCVPISEAGVDALSSDPLQHPLALVVQAVGAKRASH